MRTAFRFLLFVAGLIVLAGEFQFILGGGSPTRIPPPCLSACNNANPLFAFIPVAALLILSVVGLGLIVISMSDLL